MTSHFLMFSLSNLYIFLEYLCYICLYNSLYNKSAQKYMYFGMAKTKSQDQHLYCDKGTITYKY